MQPSESIETLKDQLLGILSHEFRTPITAITGFGSILDDGLAGSLNAAQQEYLRKMMSAADELRRLVDSMLDMGRIQAGRFVLYPRPFCFSDLVRRVLAEFQDEAERKRITLIDFGPETPLTVTADEFRVGCLLSHLVHNALKFSPDGERVVVRTTIEGDQVRCEVSDTGEGIDPQGISRLFEPFSQVDMTMTRSVGGVGLGLAICKAIAEAHGGSIGVRSERGSGSVFWFCLPLKPHNDAVSVAIAGSSA